MPLTVAALSSLAVPAMDVGSKIADQIASRTGKAQLDKAKIYIGRVLEILRSQNGKLLHPTERMKFAEELALVSARQTELVDELDLVRKVVREHKREIKNLMIRVEASSTEAAANAIKNESTRDLAAMQDRQGTPLTQSVAELQVQLRQALNVVQQAQVQATQALQAAQTVQAAQIDSNGVLSHFPDPSPTAPAQARRHQSHSTRSRPLATQSTRTPATSQSMSQSHLQHSHHPSNSISIDHNDRHPDATVSHRDRRPLHAQMPPPSNTLSASHHPSGAQEPSDSHREYRERHSSRTTVPTSTLQYTSRTQDVPSISPSRHHHHSSSRTQVPQVSPTRYTSSQAAPTTSYRQQSSIPMPSGSYMNSGNGYPNPTASHGVNHPQIQYPQSQSQSQSQSQMGHRSRTRRTSIDGFGANLHHSRPRLDDDACSDSDIEAPEPRSHRPHRAHPAQGASYGQPSFSQGYVGSVPPPGFQIVGGQAHTGWLRQMPVSDYSNSSVQYPPGQYTVQQGWPGTSAPPGYPPYGGL